MPPVLDPINSKVDGLAFLGLSLSRNHFNGLGEGRDGVEGAANQDGERNDGADADADADANSNANGAKEGEGPKLGHPESYTHQTSFDLNEVIDRNYEFLQSTDDNGWLVGGGEFGPPTSYKLAALDSAHVEIMRIGTYRKDWGGLDLEELLGVMASGSILIPQIEVLPTDVVENPDSPPELEIRFDMRDAAASASGAAATQQQLSGLERGDFEAFCRGPLPINWQLRFLHNQFFKTFLFPSRFCPGAFHSTILRKADFRSPTHRKLYFDKCNSALAKWRSEGPKPLNTVPRHLLDGRPLTPIETKEEAAALKASLKAQKTEGSKELEKFHAAIEKKNSHDTDFVPPTREETEAVAELVDKLAAMGPIPDVAKTAKPTANLEVSLDEEGTDEGETDEGTDDEEYDDDDEEVVVEVVQVRNVKTKDVNTPRKEALFLGDEDEGNIANAESTTERKERTGLYRNTWDDVVSPASSKEGETANEGAAEASDAASNADPMAAGEATSSKPVVASAEKTDRDISDETTNGNETNNESSTIPDTNESDSEAPTTEALADSTADSYTGNNIAKPPTAPEDCHSGIWLFTDRENITHFFKPNFYPPYDTPEKKKIIFDVLREEWDEDTLSWKPFGHGSMKVSKPETVFKTKTDDDKNNNIFGQAEELMSGVISTVMEGVCSPQASPRKKSASVLS